MAIKRMDEVLAAIAAGKSNTEIREQIDGRIGDKAINQLRKHPANADVPWPEETAPETGRTTAPKKTKAAGAKVPEWSRMTTSLIEEIDPPMTMATAIRELVRYVMTDDVDHLIEAALAINARMNKEKRRIKR